MISVVGIGEFCSKLANGLSKYSQYNVYTIADSKISTNCLVVKSLDNAEQYEKEYSEFAWQSLIKDSNNEISVIVDGSEAVSGVVLALLEKFRDRKINVYYVKSDLELMGNIEKLQHKVCFGILQEYARSGLFENFVLFDKTKLENMLNNVSILEIEEEMATLINSTLHYVNVYSNLKPMMANNVSMSDITRIQTIGLSEIGSLDINWFYDLENIEEVIYYFAINSDTLKKEKKLLQTIKNQVKEKQKENNIKVSFGIFETKYNQNFVYCVGKTKHIQQQQTA
jgi:hypothetical protein